MAKKYFKFYTEYKDTFNLLSVRQQHKLLMALIDYVNDGILPIKLNAKTMMVFNALKPIIDGDIEYERIRQERVKAGKKGYVSKAKKHNSGKNQANSSKN